MRVKNRVSWRRFLVASILCGRTIRVRLLGLRVPSNKTGGGGGRGYRVHGLARRLRSINSSTQEGGFKERPRIYLLGRGAYDLFVRRLGRQMVAEV